MLLINTECTKLFVLELLKPRPNQKEEALFAILCIFLESTLPKIPPQILFGVILLIPPLATPEPAWLSYISACLVPSKEIAAFKLISA